VVPRYPRSRRRRAKPSKSMAANPPSTPDVKSRLIAHRSLEHWPATIDRRACTEHEPDRTAREVLDSLAGRPLQARRPHDLRTGCVADVARRSRPSRVCAAAFDDDRLPRHVDTHLCHACTWLGSVALGIDRHDPANSRKGSKIAAGRAGTQLSTGPPPVAYIGPRWGDRLRMSGWSAMARTAFGLGASFSLSCWIPASSRGARLRGYQ